MSNWQLETPVLFLIFNRPDTTARVFETIRLAQPPRLYIAADGPRHNKPGEADKVEETRRAVLDNIDWNCQVHTLFRDTNLGCRQAVSRAIDWFFDNEEAGIILEDDVVPHPTFFRFCELLLDRYRDNEKVMHITGNNFQFGKLRCETSYYFSRYVHVWGWASWRRAWQHYADVPDLWSSGSYAAVLDMFETAGEKDFWRDVLSRVFSGSLSSWAYQWSFAVIARQALAVTPAVNLVTNIGFGQASTHTNQKNRLAEIPTEALRFPLNHPTTISRNVEADRNVSRSTFTTPGKFRRVFYKVRQLLGRL